MRNWHQWTISQVQTLFSWDLCALVTIWELDVGWMWSCGIKPLQSKMMCQPVLASCLVLLRVGITLFSDVGVDASTNHITFISIGLFYLLSFLAMREELGKLPIYPEPPSKYDVFSWNLFIRVYHPPSEFGDLSDGFTFSWNMWLGPLVIWCYWSVSTTHNPLLPDTYYKHSLNYEHLTFEHPQWTTYQY